MKRFLGVMFVAVLLTGSALATGSVSWGQPTTAECDPGGDCTGFEKSQYEVFESAGFVNLVVLAAWGPPAAQGQIDYRTADLNARSGFDYQPTRGTLTFAGGGSQQIRIPINVDGLAEGEERFEVVLSNYRGSFINRGHERAVVKILDDPSRSASIPTPLDQGSQNAGTTEVESTDPDSPPRAQASTSEEAVVQPQDPRPAPRGPRTLRPYVAKGTPQETSWFGLVASIATLLLVVGAGLKIVLKRRFG